MNVIRQFSKAIFLTIIGAAACLADTSSRFTVTGNNTACSCQENAQVDFTAFSVSGDLQIILSNFADTFFDRQVLTGIQFKFGSTPPTSGGSVSSQTPAGSHLYNIDDANVNPKFTVASGAVLTAWHTAVDATPYVTLTNLGGTGSQGGAQGIIGSATSGATNNLSNHDPLVLGVATILLHGVTGVTGTTAITGVNFNFGTALDNYLPGTGGVVAVTTATPEPGTMALFLGAGLVLLGYRRSRS